MHADQLIKGDELNCLRHRRCAADACLVILDSDSSVSATIDHFLTWLADATNAGLRQMYVRPCSNQQQVSLMQYFCRSAAIGLDVSTIAAQLDSSTTQSPVMADA